MLFVKGIRIPVGGGAKTFASVMAPHQLETFETIAPSLHQLRDGQMPDQQRWWIERTKKAAKDADLALILIWLVAFARRPFYAQVAAADKDQAAIVRRRMETVLHYNPWLKTLIDLRAYKAIQLGLGLGVLDILAADIAGSHGEAPDLLVCNELTHVQKWEFMENLFDNADGVAHGMVIIATNAGFKGTKQETMRNAALESEKKGRLTGEDRPWAVKLFSRPAPWHSKAFIEDAKVRNTVSRFNRLWMGRWVSGKGDAMSEDDIDRCLAAHKGPLTKPEKGWEYIAGLDLGISHDHAAMVILGVNCVQQRLRLAWMKAFVPHSHTKQVDLIDVSDTLLKQFRFWKLKYVGYDPYECRLMAQQLKRQGVPMQEMTFSSPKNLTVMAASLVQAVSGKMLSVEEREGKKSKRPEDHLEIPEITTTLEAYEDEEGRLRRDFGKLSVVEKPYGYKLEAVSDEYGHADIGVALAVVLPRAIDMLAGRLGLQEDDELDAGDEPTEEEFAEMPDELKDLYDEFTTDRRKV